MNDFQKHILDGNFNTAYNLAKEKKKKEICDELIEISIKTQNILVYGFITYALLQKETVSWHSVAISVLEMAFSYVEGAYELAYCHAKRALELEPDSFEALSNIMFLSGYPDTNGTKEDFEWAKNRIRELYPNDSILKLEYGRGMPLKDLKNSKLAELNKN